MEVVGSVRRCACGSPWSNPSTSGQPGSKSVRNNVADPIVAQVRKFPLLCLNTTKSRGGPRHALVGPLQQRNGAWIQGLPKDALLGRGRCTVAHGITVDRSKQLERTSGQEGEEDEVCPLNCVKEIYSQDELQHHMEEAGPNSLVVVDFYRTACGSCKYIEKGFMKLCKGESEDEEEGGQHHVVFLKHNVMNEYDEQSDIAEDLRIKVVPLFHFYKDGQLVESFATRDKNKLLATIYRYTNREAEIDKLLQA